MRPARARRDGASTAEPACSPPPLFLRRRGFIYLIIGLYSMCYWSKGNIAKRDAVLSMQTH